MSQLFRNYTNNLNGIDSVESLHVPYTSWNSCILLLTISNSLGSNNEWVCEARHGQFRPILAMALDGWHQI